MLLRDHQPFPDFEEYFNADTAQEMPALPKFGSTQRGPWTPPPYWRDLLEPQKKFDIEKCTGRILFVIAALFTLSLAMIYLIKLLLIVLTMK